MESLDHRACASDRACPAGPCVDGVCVACAAGPDCDGDGVGDACAIAAGSVSDCDGNRRPDRCDLQAGALDCDGDGQLDACKTPDPPCATASERGFVTYLPGTLPIIVTVPHGGVEKPADLADRSRPGPRDEHTIELARALDEALLARTGARPHRVTVHLHRSKLDVNRDLARGAEGDPAAERAWTRFHDLVEEAKRAARAQHGWGLVVDLHGLGASRPHHQLGVLVTAQQLAAPDTWLAHPGHALGSSVRNLAAEHPEGLAGLLRGPDSLGERLGAAGFPTLPSPKLPAPDLDEGAPYYSGGYITWRHGSRLGGCIDAIQVEVQAEARRSERGRRRFAAALADGLLALDLRPAEPPKAASPPPIAVWPQRVSDGDRVRVVLPPRTGLEGLARPGLRWIGEVDGHPSGRWARVALVEPGGRSFALPGGRLRVDDPELDPELVLWVEGVPEDRSTAWTPVHALPPELPVDRKGASGGAFRLDRAGARLVALGVDYGDGPFSLGFWFEAAEPAKRRPRYLLGHGRPGRERSLGVLIDGDGTLRTLLQGAGESAAPDALTVPAERLTGGGHYYALVVEPGPVATVYLDGVPVARADRGLALGTPRTPLHVGGRPDWVPARDFAGWVDRLVVLRRPLAPDEVAGLAGGAVWPVRSRDAR